jgi:DNA-binding response OmpR family regulator
MIGSDGNRRSVLVVASSLAQFKHVKDCLPDWEYECLLLAAKEPQKLPVTFRTPTLILVFDRKGQRETLALCAMLRHAEGIRGGPILLAVERDDIHRGHAVTRMGRASLVITPFSQLELEVKIAEALRAPRR